MGGLPSRLWQLCLLRIGPQDLPWSPALARNLVLAALAVGLANAVVGGRDGAMLVPRLLLSFAFLVVVPWLLLRGRDRLNRLAQSVSAIAGSSVYYGLAFLPISALGAGYERGMEPPPALVVATWIGLLLTGWKLAVNGHIWRHALDIPRPAGLLLAFGLFLVQVAADWQIMLMLGLVEPAP